MQPTPSPPTIDTVAGYLHRRGRSAHALTAGEAATLAIAVVRGCATAPSRAAPGEWRLTAEGQPVLVADPGGEDVLAATVAVLDDVASLLSADVRPGFARLRDGVLTEPPPTWALLEKRLLAVVEPHPLVLGPLAPAAVAARHTSPEEPDATSSTFVARLRAAVRRVRPPVFIFGAGVAAVLAIAAAMLTTTTEPSGDSAEHSAAPSTAPSSLSLRGDVAAATAEGTDPTPREPSGEPSAAETATSEDGTSTSSASGERQDAAETATTELGDVRSAAIAVLSSLFACPDERCTSPLRESAGQGSDPAPLDPAQADLDVVDDFGGLAVVRLTAESRTQYVTLVRQEDRWLVRSVRDAADQPS